MKLSLGAAVLLATLIITIPLIRAANKTDTGNLKEPMEYISEHRQVKCLGVDG
jgi:ABC-type sulfate transport system permease component